MPNGTGRQRGPSFRLNTLHRRRTLGADVVEASEEFEIENMYYSARNEIRQVVGLLDLSGPDELAACARAVREADRDLEKVRFDVENAPAFDRHTLPLAVRETADAMEAEVRTFVDVTRRYVR